MPTVKKAPPTEGRVVRLGEYFIPEEDNKLLQLGPKFALEPVLCPPAKLAASRAVSRLVPEEERARCVSECVDAIAKAKTSCVSPNRLNLVARDLASRGLRVLTADKEGCFVVLPDGMFGQKACEAMDKNFKRIDVKPAKEKTACY